MRQQARRARVVAVVIAALAVPAVAPAPAAAAPAGQDRIIHPTGGAQAPAAPTQRHAATRRPRARAACPVCPVIAVTAIRTIAVRAAPIAIRAASRIGSSGARRRVGAGARRIRTFTRRATAVTAVRAVALFERLPKYAKGCGRGFVDYIRDTGDLRLAAVFVACGRGIVDIYLGKSPYRPVDR